MQLSQLAGWLDVADVDLSGMLQYGYPVKDGAVKDLDKTVYEVCLLCSKLLILRLSTG